MSTKEEKRVALYAIDFLRLKSARVRDLSRAFLSASFLVERPLPSSSASSSLYLSLWILQLAS